MKLLQCVLLAAFVATGTLQVGAVTAPAKTNWVSNLNFTLTAWKSGSSTPARANSKDIIASFNGTTSGTNTLNFPASAQLLLKQSLGTNPVVVNNLGTNTQIIVRKVVSGKNTDTDVSGFFGHSTAASAKTTTTTETMKHEVGGLSLENNNLSFELATFTTEVDGKVSPSGATGIKQFNSSGNGSGTANGTNIVINGTVTTSGGRLE
jgi:hypothetical protein